MKPFTLSQRLSAVFAVLLLACSGVSVWLQVDASNRHDQVTVQALSAGLAGHIANTSQLMDSAGWRPDAVHALFNQLMAVNPAVEVYLLSRDGQVVGNAAPEGRIKRQQVDLAPIRRLLEGGSLPILGDDPRSLSGQKVFSAAPVQVNGHDGGFVYVILQGQDRDALAAHLSSHSLLQPTLWAMGLMAAFSLVMGLIAFRLITRPLRGLTAEVRALGADGQPVSAAVHERQRGDEIATLRSAFAQMRLRIAEQWAELTRQDQQRRDMLANISHDLRTPLTSLHGYLETLRLKDQLLTGEERRHYLDVALGQSRKVGRLAQELFELARLESGLVQPESEDFSLADLIQDVLQKFELASESRQQRLLVDISEGLPAVRGDLGMIERVLTNLLDNAIRHNPAGTDIGLQLRRTGDKVSVRVSDNGAGIPQQLREGLFTRLTALRRVSSTDSGGLGLVIVQRMLQLHGSEICLVDVDKPGTAFEFLLDCA
ncbi:HAMP domain-containing sensor histidine kinase [Pseudomonas sp. HR96]|uniref:sensor histidine kinase n=1 Tax=Pseudomonas sp. HR96 TaxID=1027966 RepID=UPI002A75539A|nr:HAMP domain-containing sensor histidine kinase [Pseudomonas sp. HR96]WPO99944.1 HAMP domain-containing sensor histidine kinase [Pseudomonas sp. HR96]